MAGKLYLNGTYAARIYFDYETAVGKAEIDRRDILLCKLILSFSPVNHQCKFPTSHCELSKLRCVWVFLIQLISKWVPLGFLKYRLFFGDFTTILFTSKLASFCVCRGIVLEPPCPRRVDGISIDPEPNCNFDNLLDFWNRVCWEEAQCIFKGEANRYLLNVCISIGI